jgi:hypothetical protein
MQFTRSVLWLTLIALALLAPLAQPAQAQKPEYGYLWSLEFDFEHNFNGLLTIEVGPWKNGDLVAVDATSKATVPCKRVGIVYLKSGDAVFDGGHLECELNLGAIILANHGLVVAPQDSYGSILFRTDLESTAANVAPIFTHPDARYVVDFSQTWAVTVAQELENNLGPQQAFFPGVIGFSRNTYTLEYGCVWLGPCNSTFAVGPSIQVSPPGGDRISFATTPTTFMIGRDGGTTFRGRMGALLIDPGNTVH